MTKTRNYFLALVLLAGVVGCIENDLPYPTIEGEVESMVIDGESELKIDNVRQVVSVTLNDDVDLRKVRIADMSITPDSRSTLDSGDVIDLTGGGEYAINGPYSFTISTFQDYEWAIEAVQPIDRKLRLSGSIGSAIFDVDNRRAVANVSAAQDLYAIQVLEFQLGPSNAVYTPNPYTISDFSEPVDFTVEYNGIVEHWTVDVQHSYQNVVTGSANPWSKFAYLSGDVLPGSILKAGFEYKESGAESWTVLEAQPSSGKIEAVAVDLQPNISYVFRAFLGEEYGDEVSFTTTIAPSVPNMNFDEAYFENSSWYFNASGGNSYWATGNEGIKAAGKAASTTSVDDAVSGKAVKMVTYNGVLLVSVAAGNIYTGTYKTILSSTPSEALKSAVMGRPYSGRPTMLKGWYKYTPAVIGSGSYWPKAATDFGVNFADSVGRNDWCHIYIALEKWPDGAEVRPDESLITTIGYGELRGNQEVSGYTQFEIPIEYYDLVTEPNHISIVATSSLNGGFFCGAAGSELYVDDFEFSFDYIP